MSEEIVERFRFGLEAWNRGDIDAVIDLFHPEIEWDDSRRLIEPGTYTGHAEVRRHFVDNLLAAWEELRIDVEEIFEADGKLVTVLWMRGRGRASGVETEAQITLVWTVREGRAVRMEYFGDRAEALASLGDPPSGGRTPPA